MSHLPGSAQQCVSADFLLEWRRPVADTWVPVQQRGHAVVHNSGEQAAPRVGVSRVWPSTAFTAQRGTNQRLGLGNVQSIAPEYKPAKIVARPEAHAVNFTRDIVTAAT